MKRSRNERPAAGVTSPAETLIWWSLQLGLIAIPLWISRGRDVYRIPKELLFAGFAIVIFAACAIVSILDPQRGILQRLRNYRATVIIALAAVGWTGVEHCFQPRSS
jgi:hypothetical protein